MKVEKRYKEQYKTGNTPWDIGQPDFNLIKVISEETVENCKALDIGCGTGDNSIWLAQNHFQVVGTDISEIAIEKAKEKASKANIKCDFILVDFLKKNIDEAPFGFVFDRGCFHSFDSETDREKFAKNVAAHLEISGLWLTLAGNADENREEPGPPQRTARDIVFAVEPYFEIIFLKSGHFSSNRPDPPKGWICLMQKRHIT